MSRTAETKTIRRRRAGMGLDRSLKMHVPEDKKDPNFVYRWFNDVPGRIESKTVHDDWDVMTEQRNGEEVKIMRPVQPGADGKPLYAYLCKKPKDLYEQDKKEEQKVLDAQEEAMRRGPLPSQSGLGSDPQTAYTPGGRNVIARG